MTHAVFTNSLKLSLRHQANIAASLAHRIEKAKAAQDATLLALLEREQRQLSKPTSRMQAVWRSITALFQQNSVRDGVSIEPLISESRLTAWRAVDLNGDVRYAETEAELIDWLETKRDATHSRSLYGRQGFFTVLPQQFH